MYEYVKEVTQMQNVKVTVYIPEGHYLDILDLAGLKHTSVSREIAGMIELRLLELRPRIEGYRESAMKYVEEL